MKKIVSMLSVWALLLTLLPLGAVSVSAATEGDYTYDIFDGEATITDYTGSATALTIPATLGGYSVTAIGEEAFSWCISLTEVTIGDSVTTIGAWAFYRCASLTEVTIPDSVTAIGAGAFDRCTSLTGVTIPDSVTAIGAQAFSNCDSLTEVTIGDSVTTIGDFAFSNCDSLTEVTIPDSVTTIGEGAFFYCDGLTEVTIGDRVTTIGAQAFCECTSLTEVTIPDSVTAIGVWAFAYCTSLTDVYYSGTEQDRAAMSIDNYNDPLLNATWHYNVKPLAITAESSTARYAKEGAKVSATVTAQGDGLTYAWYFRNATGKTYSKSSVKSATYSTTMSDKVKGRRVYCVVTDKYGKKVTSKTFLLREQVSIISQPATARYAKEGAKVSVKINASGDGLKYTWYFRNATGTKYSKSSVTSATYSTTMSDKVKGRRVYCVVTDKYGKKVTSKTFLLREQVSIISQPATARYAKTGAKASVKIKASGDGLKYTWHIKNAGSSKYSKSSVKSATYAVKMSSKVNGRRVYCVVTDKYGKKVQTKTFILKRK